MEMASKSSWLLAFASFWQSIVGWHTKLRNHMSGFIVNMKKVAQDDPRRIVHALKVGLALSLVSMLYYYKPLYDSFGMTAIWAMMTVVVVFEFSVGATIGKGFNRGVATLLAGVLGVGAHYLASLSGHIAEPILLAIFVFLQATSVTFLRFVPKIKARYDYGLLIFILTFSLVSISGFREAQIIELAHRRLSTVLIGAAICFVISICLSPVWAGQDLQDLIADNIEKLGDFLEGFGHEYFKPSSNKESIDDDNTSSPLQGYKSILTSKNTEESLANFGRWEPGHGRFQFGHPWNQYLHVGTLTRRCAYRIDSLSVYLHSEASLEIKSKFQETFTGMSMESSQALKELALSIKSMTVIAVDPHIKNAQSFSENLNNLLKSDVWKDASMLEVVSVGTVASLLIDIVNCIQEIATAVNELAKLARFSESPELLEKSDKEHPEAGTCVVVVVDDDNKIGTSV